jgi:cystathionine gamma-synthase
MASVAATLFAHLSSGDHLVVGDELFAITTVLMEEDLPKRGIAVTAVGHHGPRAVEAAITPDAPAVPGVLDEPRLRLADLDTITAMAHRPASP